MNGGTLAVSFNADRSAAIVGYIPRSDWDLQDKHAGVNEDKLIMRVPGGQFDLEKQLPAIMPTVQKNGHKSNRPVHSNDIAQFCGHRQEMKIAKQREFVEQVLGNEDCWSDLEAGISKAFVRRTLTHASVWNQKLEKLAETVQSKFHRLSKEEVKMSIAKVGERMGGQVDSKQFRKEVLVSLTREELSRSLAPEALAKASKLVDQIFAGRSVLDVLKDSVKSKTAIDIAVTIKRQRQKVTNFIEASSDEISLAFRQLALQPVYATHSQSEEGVESVNEALKLLDACELAESLKELEKELD
jgi:hypothetical protein